LWVFLGDYYEAPIINFGDVNWALMPEVCNDNVDNNCDSIIDCDDPFCDGKIGGLGICQFLSETVCDDSFDNDRNGLPDCKDLNCDGEPCDMADSNKICISGVCQ
jgi:hypothetical protein